MFYEKLLNIELIYFKDCYKLDCKGHCCNSNKDEDCIIPMLKSEYEFLKDKSDLKADYNMDFLLNCGKKITIIFAKCNKKGLCKIRPLACKLYPFYAKTNLNADYLGFEFLSLYDMFYTSNFYHPCSLVKGNFLNLQKQFENNIVLILNEAVMIFIFMSLELLHKYLNIYFKNIYGLDFNLNNIKDKKRFFKENNFLKAWQVDEFKKEFNDLYLKLESKYKDDLKRYL
ncbi:hypothetical protein [Campylobacter canadensis]|uniref:YkgJ family cysteine cluster protein n=1 Tax=Campylobacter canadensis TaxID=449520 RepID=A0ABS7WTF6_9BACT|nr:hypothetical protein [Campylobacter canadensis]MBZ7987823.1 hypothetical protein [Campylobacter canadensis]MBZ7998832.1 hypothetical protein [Campylobacter canadensis]